jgi:hypothetical protein
MNALQPDVYDGSMERYGRAGHIPGSLNVFSDDLFDAQTGELLPVEQLRKKFEHARPFDRRTIRVLWWRRIRHLERDCPGNAGPPGRGRVRRLDVRVVRRSVPAIGAGRRPG